MEGVYIYIYIYIYTHTHTFFCAQGFTGQVFFGGPQFSPDIVTSVMPSTNFFITNLMHKSYTMMHGQPIIKPNTNLFMDHQRIQS